MEINLSIDSKEVTTIIKDFIKTYVKNSGCKGVVIGLSGGIDSILTAIICKDALGKKNVKCLFLPDDTTPKNDIKHFKLIIKKYGLQAEEKNISDLVNTLSKNSFVKPNKQALANIKARARMILIYEYANMKNYLVCGTSNKSELLIGYFTKYGDGGVDIMPIGDLYKTQVWELAKYLKIPKEIISKAPTAGLWKGQTDEKEFGISYHKLDIILNGLEQKLDYNNIAKLANVKKSEVDRVNKMIVRSHHKRRTALIPKIGLRTPGFDWRSPIQEG